MDGKVAVIGECMLELRQLDDIPTAVADGGQPGSANPGPLSLGYGGDTLNTAVYLARLGAVTDYVTALGDDSLSGWMIDQWQAEGVGCELVQRFENSVPGMYLIQTDPQGERSFLYWRDSAPARRLFDDEKGAARLFETLAGYQWIYLSGITLALYSAPTLDRLLTFLDGYQRDGGKLVFDGNYRPRLWSDTGVARAAFEALYRMATIALPTLEDESLLFGEAQAEDVVERLRSWGVFETVVKRGAAGCLVASNHECTVVPAHNVPVVDTTAAGDSFNAGYLAARMAGRDPVTAAAQGHRLASVVIGHRGAVIPAHAMPGAR
jgi:2-dehydro-3-deoxygluconokinase